MSKSKKVSLEQRLEEELQRTYHNGTFGNSKYQAESDFEADQVESEVRSMVETEFSDLENQCPLVCKFGEVYQYGRGGRTVAPDYIIRHGGGSSFSIKHADDFIDDPVNARRLLKALKQLNDYVEAFCTSAYDRAFEYVRESMSKELKKNKGKKRQHYSGVRYV